MKPSRAVRRQNQRRPPAEPDRSGTPESRENPVANAAKALRRAAVRLWLAPVRFYRRFLSPLKGQSSCRYTPTCSAYAMDAVEEWGILCGTLLAVLRILRCNPFSRGGYDPVPKRKDVFARIRAHLARRADTDADSGKDPPPDEQSNPMER